jgi:hypothetical protein
MNINEFKNSCRKHRETVDTHLQEIEKFLIKDKKILEELKINEWNKTIDLELLYRVHYIFMKCLLMHHKPKQVKKYEKIIKLIEDKLRCGT